MGACTSSTDVLCTRKKYSRPGPKEIKNVIRRPENLDPEVEEPTLSDPKQAMVGVYFIKEELITKLPKSHSHTQMKQSRFVKWKEMITYGLDPLTQLKVFPNGKQTKEPDEFTEYALVGLQNFYNNHPHKFLSRLGKGPPPSYRWLAWRFMSGQIIAKEKGLYQRLLEQGKDNKWLHDIDKDLYRTYPLHPLFDVQRYGQIGQKVLRNILQAYAEYNPEVGYCQSMNFIAGFIMLTSGCKETESFWLFAALLQLKQSPNQPQMSGLHGFYSLGFPLLTKFQQIFDVLFQEQLPQLKLHFQDEGLPDLLWITKWFQSCFLYNFPLGLCLRIWDNIFAYGTRFLLSTALTILRLCESQLLQLNLGDINDFFKQFKDEDEQRASYRLLPDFELIITESVRGMVSDERIDVIRQQLDLSTFKEAGQGSYREQLQPHQDEEQQQQDEEREREPEQVVVNADLNDQVVGVRRIKKKRKVARGSVNSQPKQIVVELLPSREEQKIDEMQVVDISLEDKMEEQQAKGSQDGVVKNSSDIKGSSSGNLKESSSFKIITYDDIKKSSKTSIEFKSDAVEINRDSMVFRSNEHKQPKKIQHSTPPLPIYKQKHLHAQRQNLKQVQEDQKREDQDQSDQEGKSQIEEIVSVESDQQYIESSMTPSNFKHMQSLSSSQMSSKFHFQEEDRGIVNSNSVMSLVRKLPI